MPSPRQKQPRGSDKANQGPPTPTNFLWGMVSRVFKGRRRPATIVFCIVVAALTVWWHWDKVQHVPGLKQVAIWWYQQPLPKADPNRFAVAVTHLDNDDDRNFEKLIIEALKEFEGAQVLHVDRFIPLEGVYPKEMEKAGSKKAQGYLQETGAQVLIWGRVIKMSGRSLAKLYWTASEELGQSQAYGRYQPTQSNDLPSIFWEDLAEVLRLLIATQYRQFEVSHGKFAGSRLSAFIEKVRQVLKGSENRPGWDQETRGQTRLILANSLGILGDESGDRQPLDEAVQAYREALKEFPRETAPLKWAEVQNNLGVVLLMLGERDSGTKYLEEAVQVYREALKESTRERVPLSWAMTQNNLGNALLSLGDREQGTKRLEEAVQAYREALKERNRERVPLRWGEAQHNLGNTLATLGDRMNSVDLLCSALDAHCLAWEILSAESPFQAPLVRNAIREDILALTKSFNPEKGKTCVKTHADVLNRLGK